MTILAVERWTLDGIEDIEVHGPDELEAFVASVTPGTWLIARPCGETHTHVLLLKCPTEVALRSSDVPVVYERLGAVVQERTQQGVEGIGGGP